MNIFHAGPDLVSIRMFPNQWRMDKQALSCFGPDGIQTYRRTCTKDSVHVHALAADHGDDCLFGDLFEGINHIPLSHLAANPRPTTLLYVLLNTYNMRHAVAFLLDTLHSPESSSPRIPGMRID